MWPALLSAIQTILPYLLVLWLIPFLVIAIKMMRRSSVAVLQDFPYARKRALFSPAERSLLRVLERAVGTDYRIFGKVRAADVLDIKPSADRSAWFGAFNQIRDKNFDFLLCDKENLSIRCAIALKHRGSGSQAHHQRHI
jgi:hypothetical protein